MTEINQSQLWLSKALHRRTLRGQSGGCPRILCYFKETYGLTKGPFLCYNYKNDKRHEITASPLNFLTTETANICLSKEMSMFTFSNVSAVSDHCSGSFWTSPMSADVTLVWPVLLCSIAPRIQTNLSQDGQWRPEHVPREFNMEQVKCIR